MKALMTIIISIGLFVAALILGMALSLPAEASGCYSSGSGCTTPTPTTTSTSTSSSDKHTITALEVIAIVAIAACPVIAIYTRIAHGRWTWCGESDKKEPPPDFGPALQVTPEAGALSDHNRTIIIEAN